jgi:sugar phosphate isomerase/epimerase
MLKYSYNTNGLRNMSLIKAIEEIKHYGYGGVEISLHKTHLHPFNIKDGEVELIKKVLGENCITATNVATGCADLLSDKPYEPSIICSDKKGRETRLRLMTRTMEIASYLGIPVVTFATGFKSEDISDEKAYEYLQEGISHCLGKVKNVILALEPEPGMFIQKSTEAIRLIKEMGDDRLALNLDIGHVYCCEDEPVNAIEKSIMYDRHIHIEDIKDRIHYHQIPGEGDIDFQTIIGKLLRLDYRYYISVELYHHAEVWMQALSRSLKYLRETEQKVLKNMKMDCLF